jgi:hypothetical protein
MIVKEVITKDFHHFGCGVVLSVRSFLPLGITAQGELCLLNNQPPFFFILSKADSLVSEQFSFNGVRF